MATSTIVSAQAVDPRDHFTTERYKALRLLWRRTSLDSVKSCQHHSIVPGGNVKVLVTPTSDGPRVGFGGLATCGSVWACPVCSNKIAARRTQEIAAAVRKWESMGGRVALVTLTMRHNKGQRLADLWANLSKSWAAVLKNEWNDDQLKYGVPVERVITHGKRKGQTVIEKRIGWMRAVEATHPVVNGWHLHIHALLFLKGEPDLDGLSKSMFQRWRGSLVAAGMAAPIATKGGLDARWIESGDGEIVGEYVAPGTYDGALRAGMELARGGQKKAGGQTPFQMLASVCENYDNADDALLQARAAADLGRWYEWEQASKGRRQITWSRWLRAYLALEDESTDEDIVAEDGTTDETLISDIMSSEVWATARRDIPAVRRRAIVWYQEEYLPMIADDPDFERLRREARFKERVARK